MINFLNATLEIKREIKSIDDVHDSYAKRVAPRQYIIYLVKGWDVPTLIHELWHIYMDCLTCFDSGNISPLDLEKDIYAYSFERLVRDSLQEVSKEES